MLSKKAHNRCSCRIWFQMHTVKKFLLKITRTCFVFLFVTNMLEVILLIVLVISLFFNCKIFFVWSIWKFDQNFFMLWNICVPCLLNCLSFTSLDWGLGGRVMREWVVGSLPQNFSILVFYLHVLLAEHIFIGYTLCVLGLKRFVDN